MKQIAREVVLKPCGDARGYLLALEGARDVVPFPIRRVYFMYGIPTAAERGKHAHADTRQLLVCVNGSFKMTCDFGPGKEKRTFILDNPTKGLYLEGFVWREMSEFAPNTVIAVLADEHYDEAAPKEVRDYGEFLRRLENNKEA